MKVLFILLIPFFMYSQNPYPDTLFMLQGKSYPCLVSGINESKVGIIYSNDINETAILKSVDKIWLENYGIIYSSDQGFLTSLETISSFVDNRMEQREEQQLIQEEQNKLEASAKGLQISNGNKVIVKNHIQKDSKNNFKRWSFGVLYVPYFEGRIYTLEYSYNNQYPPSLYQSAINETNMEAQLTFHPSREIGITIDIGYQSTYYERRQEEHIRQLLPETNYDVGFISKEGLKLLDFTIGVKYYFENFIEENVSIYALVGFGKQIAWVEAESEVLFREPNPEIIIENNEEEYIKDLNSPFHFNFGFGAEYFFNNSLSLTSNIRFLYSKISADYDARYIAPNETRNMTSEYKKSDFATRVGLGLNFYF